MLVDVTNGLSASKLSHCMPDDPPKQNPIKSDQSEFNVASQVAYENECRNQQPGHE